MPEHATFAPITVAMCTRNRGRSICEALDTVLLAGTEVEAIIVVDQSTDDETCSAVAPYLADSRLRLIRSEQIGLSNARNLALQQATTECVFMTDDDCVVPQSYAIAAQKLFATYAEAAAIYTRVEAAPHDARLGTVPVFLPRCERVLKSIAQLRRSSGIGAGLLLRRTAWTAVGGFDSYLGPGGVFQSADDVDYTVRLLLLGYCVVESCKLSVIHHGYRTNDEFKQLVRRDWFGIGAAYAKPMRTTFRRQFAPVLAADLLKRSIVPFLRNLVRLRPYGIASLTSFLKGYRAGMRQPMDAEQLLYQDAGGP